MIEDTERIAVLFRALGDPTRLRILRFLSGACCPVAVSDENGAIVSLSGPTAGEVCCYVTGGDGPITSTVSHHLKELRLAGLITMEKQGRRMICGIQRAALTDLFDFLSTFAQEEKNNGCC